MDRKALESLWNETLRDAAGDRRPFEMIAQAVVDVYSTDSQFRQHIKNRSARVLERTGVEFDPDRFDLEMARAYIADELGFDNWNGLMQTVEYENRVYPLKFSYAIAAMERGDFSAIESAIGPEHFFQQVREWYEQGLFANEQETLDELLSAACMLGQTETAAFLLDRGVDPYAGMRSWLAGPHYAASSGRLGVVRMLIERGIPLEVENKYGGTVLGQALWSAINEDTSDHAEIIERLIDAGAYVWPETLQWWEQQPVPSAETKARVTAALKAHGAS